MHIRYNQLYIFECAPYVEKTCAWASLNMAVYGKIEFTWSPTTPQPQTGKMHASLELMIIWSNWGKRVQKITCPEKWMVWYRRLIGKVNLPLTPHITAIWLTLHYRNFQNIK